MDQASWDITKQVLVAIVRYMIAAFGAWLVKKGIVDGAVADAWMNQIAYAVVGVIVLLAVVAWKWLNARFNVLALIEAVHTEPPVHGLEQSIQAVEDVKAKVKAKNTAVVGL